MTALEQAIINTDLLSDLLMEARRIFKLMPR